MPNLRDHDLAGQWVLVEPQGRLLSVGKSLFYGQTPRAQLNQVGRRHLLPLITEATASGQPARKNFHEREVAYQAEARPVLGPSGAVHAVMATYVREGEKPGHQIDIGAWEWDWPERRTYWTPELFRVYGFPRPPHGRSFWEAPEWFSLTERGGFPGLMEVLSRFRTGQLSDLQIHLFRIARADTGALQRLRLAGRTIFDENNEPRWFRGVTVRVDGYQLGVDEQFTHQQYLDAALTLNQSPVFIVNLEENLKVMLNNTPWERVGLDMPEDGHLGSAVHPDDREYLAAFLATASIPPVAAPSITRIRFARGPEWQEIEIAALRLPVRHGDLEVAQAMVRLQAPVTWAESGMTRPADDSEAGQHS